MAAGDSPLCLILHNIRSCHNVGSIFRTAEAAGAQKIYLTGYTPAPVDRFGRAVKEIAKTALGAEKMISWEKYCQISPLLKKLLASNPPRRPASFQLLALEQSAEAVDYKKVKLRGPTAVVLGNEIRGLSQKILNHCDLVVQIPMRGKKESLNVAVAAGVFLFRLIDG